MAKVKNRKKGQCGIFDRLILYALREKIIVSLNELSYVGLRPTTPQAL